MKKILLVFICLCMFVTLDLKVKGNEDSEVNVQNVLDTGRYYYNGIEYNVSSFKDNGELPPTYNNASPKNGMRFQTVNGPNNQTLYFQKDNDITRIIPKEVFFEESEPIIYKGRKFVIIVKTYDNMGSTQKFRHNELFGSYNLENFFYTKVMIIELEYEKPDIFNNFTGVIGMKNIDSYGFFSFNSVITNDPYYPPENQYISTEMRNDIEENGVVILYKESPNSDDTTLYAQDHDFYRGYNFYITDIESEIEINNNEIDNYGEIDYKLYSEQGELLDYGDFISENRISCSGKYLNFYEESSDAVAVTLKILVNKLTYNGLENVLEPLFNAINYNVKKVQLISENININTYFETPPRNYSSTITCYRKIISQLTNYNDQKKYMLYNGDYYINSYKVEAADEEQKRSSMNLISKIKFNIQIGAESIPVDIDFEDEYFNRFYVVNINEIFNTSNKDIGGKILLQVYINKKIYINSDNEVNLEFYEQVANENKYIKASSQKFIKSNSDENILLEGNNYFIMIDITEETNIILSYDVLPFVLPCKNSINISQRIYLTSSTFSIYYDVSMLEEICIKIFNASTNTGSISLYGITDDFDIELIKQCDYNNVLWEIEGEYRTLILEYKNINASAYKYNDVFIGYQDIEHEYTIPSSMSNININVYSKNCMSFVTTATVNEFHCFRIYDNENNLIILENNTIKLLNNNQTFSKGDFTNLQSISLNGENNVICYLEYLDVYKILINKVNTQYILKSTIDIKTVSIQENCIDSYFDGEIYDNDNVYKINITRTGLYYINFSSELTCDYALYKNEINNKLISSNLELNNEYVTFSIFEELDKGDELYLVIYGGSINGSITIITERIIYEFKDVYADPIWALPVGTAVSVGKQDYNSGITIVGLSRNIYIGSHANSESRLNYIWESTDNSIAEVSDYGTVLTRTVGYVIIECVKKTDYSQVGQIIIDVIPDTRGQVYSVTLDTDKRINSSENGTEVLSGLGIKGGTTIHQYYTRAICLGANAPSPYVQDYHWYINNPLVAQVSSFGTISAISKGKFSIFCVYMYNENYIGQLEMEVV